jgi:isopentenyl-diphosphate Delta-isomerase
MQNIDVNTEDALIPAWVDGELVNVNKLLVHQKGIKHKAVSIFLMSGRQTLIQQRAAGKYHSPLLWANSCCTHPKITETGQQCAARRLQQELGITGVSLQPLSVYEYRADVGSNMTEHEVVEMFTAQVSHDIPMELNPHEVEAVRWVDMDVLKANAIEHPDQYSEWLKIYLRDIAI